MTRKEINPQRSRADSQVNAIASFAGIGIEDRARREAIFHGLDFMRGFGIQMLGECGPRIVLFFLFVALNSKEAERRREERRNEDARRRAERTQKVKRIAAVEVRPQLPELQPEETNGSDPEITAFLTRNTTRVTSGRVPAKSLYKAWCEDCAERGVKPGTQYAFSKRVANFVNREGKNNRYTWLGIALKDRDAAPKFRVVAA